ncbi:hypothetical protein BT96DRAFT_928745 [Gymnopus androsaceus JB14]|uniref:Uncharacterized protein n=1 Tax=Gymnopus androsaceus JB14 TaxID=1447944 RepID=A0A6A4GJV1_9AGAR|nr:hypothetical protein BT96DRAFT_928745 [Gymnopus androsaceus JB14]
MDGTEDDGPSGRAGAGCSESKYVCVGRRDDSDWDLAGDFLGVEEGNRGPPLTERCGVVREGRDGVGIGEGDVRLIPGDVALAVVAAAGVERTRVRAGEPKFELEVEVTRGRGLVGVVTVDVDVSFDATATGTATGTVAVDRRLETIDGVARGLGKELLLALLVLVLRLLRFFAVNLLFGVDVDVGLELELSTEIRRPDVLLAKAELAEVEFGIGMDEIDRRFVLRLLPMVDMLPTSTVTSLYTRKETRRRVDSGSKQRLA